MPWTMRARPEFPRVLFLQAGWPGADLQKVQARERQGALPAHQGGAIRAAVGVKHAFSVEVKILERERFLISGEPAGLRGRHGGAGLAIGERGRPVGVVGEFTRGGRHGHLDEVPNDPRVNLTVVAFADRLPPGLTHLEGATTD